MRRLASDTLNGAIFAALVVLASATEPETLVQSDPVSADAKDTGSQSEETEVPSAGRESFAVPSLAGTSPGDSAGSPMDGRSDNFVGVEQGSEKPLTTPPAASAGAAPRAGKQAALQGTGEHGRPVSAGEPAFSRTLPSGAKAAAKVDALVPPIRRQRPETPPLVFKAPSEKQAVRKSRKAAKSQPKRAASKRQDGERSSLGASSREAATADSSKSKSQ